MHRRRRDVPFRRRGPCKSAPQGFVRRRGRAAAVRCGPMREKARELGMSMKDLAERAGVSYGYMVQAFRGHRTMGPTVRARVESALQVPAEVAPAQKPSVGRHAVFKRLNAHGISQNEAARRAGISSGHLSQIVNGQRDPSPGVLKRLHGVLSFESVVAPGCSAMLVWPETPAAA